jgi:hypothetical protein
MDIKKMQYYANHSKKFRVRNKYKNMLNKLSYQFVGGNWVSTTSYYTDYYMPNSFRHLRGGWHTEDMDKYFDLSKSISVFGIIKHKPIRGRGLFC